MIAVMPGIESVGAVSELPMLGQENHGVYQVQGKIYRANVGPGSMDGAIDHRVAGDYFQAMDIGLLKGRFLSSQDAAEAAPVVVSSEPFARRYFPQQDPIGKHLISDEEGGESSRRATGGQSRNCRLPEISTAEGLQRLWKSQFKTSQRPDLL